MSHLLLYDDDENYDNDDDDDNDDEVWLELTSICGLRRVQCRWQRVNPSGFHLPCQ